MKNLKHKTLIKVFSIILAIPVIIFLTIVLTYYILFFLIKGFSGQDISIEECLDSGRTWDTQNEICLKK